PLQQTLGVTLSGWSLNRQFWSRFVVSHISRKTSEMWGTRDLLETNFLSTGR
ncbi:MAG: hypothetical protein QOJ51_6742, partial [Acidobacteriaceae bacterium]|nr:hypothetical protein [Acidobacteriaceae bacterium]